jgi:CHAT domain-containing protein
VASLLGKKRLLIVSEGALQYVPFAALPLPRGPWSVVRGPWSKNKHSDGQRTTDNEPLVVRHEIVSLPSASALAVLRRELAGRQPATKSVAVLADPVFESDDPRVRLETGEHAPTSNLQFLPPDLERALKESGMADDKLSIPRLPFTRQEAEGIIAHVPRGSGLKALDFEACRATVTSAQLGQYRIVHFATHGLLNSQHPELSGIVLSLVDEHGQPQDGFLRAHEIYNLDLSADLVVLSGCKTGLGKEIKGEGLVGLTRGFMYAGAARVLVSLWDVHDAATAELMERFYRGMLVEKRKPAAALRAAQAAMWKEGRWTAPYYWAGFQLQGEWK